VAGVVIAHAVDYVVVIPNTAARDGHLQATGHAYWPVALSAAAGAAALALIAVAAMGARRSRLAAGRLDLNLGWLLALQAGAFVAMEAGERAMVGLPPTVLLHSPEFWFGLALQLPVAWLARRLLGAVEDVAHRIAQACGARAPVHAPGRIWRPAGVRRPFGVAVASRARPRAPPRPLASI
jgi:hypothetical protein